MGVGPIQFGGLASGLDTNAIIATLLDLQARPIRTLQGQRTQEQSRLSLIGAFEGLVKTLQDKVSALSSSTGSFFAHSVTPSNEGVASFTITGSPPTGSHTLEVLELASADRYTFENGFADPDAQTIGPGGINFDYDGVNYITLVQTTSSLNEVAAAINTQTDGEVSASVVNTGTEGTPNYQLVLTGKDTGADFAIENIVEVGLGFGASESLTTASNAKVVVDGLEVERSTNVFADVLPGLSFTAQALTPAGEPISVGVEVDVSGSESKLQGFVDAYNGVIDFINKQNTYSEEAGTGGDLFGDSLLRSVRSSIQGALFDVDLATVVADTTGYSTLGLVGFDLDAEGRLTIDSDKLEQKLTADPDALENLFLQDTTNDNTDGVLIKLDAALNNLLKGNTTNAGTSSAFSVASPFDNRRDTLSTLIDSIDDQIQRLEDSLEREEETLIRRFANLESILSGLNSQSAFLAQNLGLSQSK